MIVGSLNSWLLEAEQPQRVEGPVAVSRSEPRAIPCRPEREPDRHSQALPFGLVRTVLSAEEYAPNSLCAYATKPVHPCTSPHPADSSRPGLPRTSSEPVFARPEEDWALPLLTALSSPLDARLASNLHQHADEPALEAAGSRKALLATISAAARSGDATVRGGLPISRRSADPAGAGNSMSSSAQEHPPLARAAFVARRGLLGEGTVRQGRPVKQIQSMSAPVVVVAEHGNSSRRQLQSGQPLADMLRHALHRQH